MLGLIKRYLFKEFMWIFVVVCFRFLNVFVLGVFLGIWYFEIVVGGGCGLVLGVFFKVDFLVGGNGEFVV